MGDNICQPPCKCFRSCWSLSSLRHAYRDWPALDSVFMQNCRGGSLHGVVLQPEGTCTRGCLIPALGAWAALGSPLPGQSRRAPCSTHTPGSLMPAPAGCAQRSHSSVLQAAVRPGGG